MCIYIYISLTLLLPRACPADTYRSTSNPVDTYVSTALLIPRRRKQWPSVSVGVATSGTTQAWHCSAPAIRAERAPMLDVQVRYWLSVEIGYHECFEEKILLYNIHVHVSRCLHGYTSCTHTYTWKIMCIYILCLYM